jgi:hypothetical protein
LLEFAGWPMWATILRRVVTLVVLALCGAHAYARYRRPGGKVAVPQRWAYLAFLLIFLFGVIANLLAVFLAARRGIQQGPLNTGIFSLLLFLLYLAFAAGVGRRTHY